MSYQAGFAGEFEGSTRLELIQETLRGLGSNVTTPGTDTTADYSRYPKTDIIKKLVQAEQLFVLRTACLSTWAIIEAVASRKEYRLPKRCMRVLDAKYYTSDSDYDQLIPVRGRSQMKRISSTWNADSTGTPEYYAPGYGYGNARSIIVYPNPASSGTTYTGTTMGIVTSATDFTFSGEITGSHKTGYANSAFYVDSAGRNFVTLGVTAGMMIFNTTDGSKGQITSIASQDATYDRINVTLAGGTDNDFDVSDSIVIALGEYGVVIRASNSEEWAFTSNYGAVSDISPLSGNFLLDFIKRPLSLDIDTQYPEIPPEYHYALAEYAIWKLGSTEFNGKVARDRAMEGKEAFLGAIMDYKGYSEPEVEDDATIEDREEQEFGY